MSATVQPPLPSEPPDTGAAPLDLAGGIARVMGDRSLFARVLERFRGDYRRAAGAIRSALAAGDTLLAQRLTHTLKGASGMIEAGPLHRQARALEQALHGPEGEWSLHLDRLEAELDLVLHEVDGVLVNGAVGNMDEALRQAPPASADAGQALLRLHDMLDTGDGAALELLDELRVPLARTVGETRLREVARAIHEFDFELALKLLGPPLR